MFIISFIVLNNNNSLESHSAVKRSSPGCACSTPTNSRYLSRSCFIRKRDTNSAFVKPVHSSSFGQSSKVNFRDLYVYPSSIDRSIIYYAEAAIKNKTRHKIKTQHKSRAIHMQQYCVSQNMRVHERCLKQLFIEDYVKK